MPSNQANQITRSEVEEFLYDEAALLDEWRLNEWVDLFTEDGYYYVPSPDDPTGDPNNSVFLIADDIRQIRSRARQLLGRFAWAENPHSRTRHLITNVRILDGGSSAARITANFIVHRTRLERVDTYVGRYEYKLVRSGETFKIAERWVFLDADSLRPQAKVSIVV
jgi:p-cumate 2,3-dioxygenase beta subunit